jgi:hypothetical protein
MPDTLPEDGQSVKGRSLSQCPKEALSLSQIELNAIETEGQHFFSYKLLEWFPKMEDPGKLRRNPLLSPQRPA